MHSNAQQPVMVSVFVYGTLLDDALVECLTGRRFRKTPAVLRGYRKIAPRDGYPYIVPDPTGVVRGCVLNAVDAEALRRFDRYEDEGHLYRRTSVAVTITEAGVGETRQLAMTYVGIPEALTRSTS